MKIDASLVKQLREMTGAGMMECKKALSQTNGDIEAAVEEMRKSGQAKAAKKAGRIAAEGVVLDRTSTSKALLLEINTETDFVARDENFVKFADDVAQIALETGIDNVAELNKQQMNGKTVEESRQELIAKIGENINIRRAKVIESEFTASYNHGGRIGVIVALSGKNDEVAKDVAMHIAASTPLVISPEDMPKELVEKEREIFSAQAAQSGKPENIIEKMVEGRIKKFLSENSLLEQPFIKNPDQTVSDLLKQAGVTLQSFTRFELGEGIEKEDADFVSEVMAQVREAV